jgi:hypothetical protein
MYRKVKGSDGSVFLDPKGWYDSAREEACDFQTLSDGKLHCAPRGETPSFSPDRWFEDSSCSRPIIGFRNYKYADEDVPSCNDPTLTQKRRYVRIMSDPSGCGAVKLAEFPTKGLAITKGYRKDAEGKCREHSFNSTDQIFSAINPLAEVDPASFVAAISRDETPATSERLRLSRTRVTAEDGAVALSGAGFVDSARNELCRPRLDVNRTLRCMPYGPTLKPTANYGFIDGTCSHPASLVVEQHHDCGTDSRNASYKYMEVTNDSHCPTVQLYPRFGGSPQHYVYNKDGAGACVGDNSVSSYAGYTFYDGTVVPPAIVPSEFLPLHEETIPSPNREYAKKGSRLVAKSSTVSSNSTRTSSIGTPFDSELGVACYPMPLEDGKTYCVGGTVGLSYDTDGSYFADAQCQKQVVGYYHRPQTECGETPPKFFERAYYANGCRTYRLYEIPKEKANVPVLYQRSGGRCEAVTWNIANNDFYYRSALTPVPPSRFVQVDVTLGQRD